MLEDVVRTSELIETRLNELSAPLDLEGKSREIADLEQQATRSNFWDDPAGAQTQMQRLNALKEGLAPWLAVRKRLDDVRTLAELALLEENPEVYTEEIAVEVAATSETLDKLEIEALLSGPHDAAPAILEINAGAGGADANDWTTLLQRMYLRWADRHGFKAEILDEVEGEGGLKSTSLRLEGRNAYGQLQGERGVHRVVRISPFNKTRETSFAAVDIVPEVAEVQGVDIPDKDLKREAIRSSGAGGQHVNKTSSKIRLTHLPTGLVVAVQNERSQFQNETIAMNILKAKLLEMARQENKAGIDELRGERQDIAFGHQTRNYVFQPYTLVKDTRTAHETGDIMRVMNGEFDDFIDAFLHWQHGQRHQE